MKILITGIAGQTGSYLAEYLLENNPNDEIYGITRYRSDFSNLLGFQSKLRLYDCELRDAHNVDKVIKEIKPDIIFHLAATSFVRSSWNQPADTIINNTVSQINLFEAVLRHCPNAKIQIAGSSEQYGKVYEHEVPITEKNELRPISPYAVSKCTQETLAYQYHQSHGLYVVITRTFNHTGPRRTDSFVESSFCKQIVMIEEGLQEPIIYHGNLESVRDYTDARDVAHAYWLAVNHCNPGEPYNICSNMRVTIGDLLDMLIEKSTYDGTIKKIVDPLRLRPSDVTLLYGNSDKFNTITGWKPNYNLDLTITGLLDAWRRKIAASKILISKD